MTMIGREKLEGLDYIPAIEVRRVCTQTQQKQWPHLPQWAIVSNHQGSVGVWDVK